MLVGTGLAATAVGAPEGCIDRGPPRRVDAFSVRLRTTNVARPNKAKQGKVTTDAKSIGRPTDYTAEIAADICERIAGGDTMTKVCGSDGMPDRSTVWRWSEKHPEFRTALARAREQQAWSWADEAVDIADGAGGKATGSPGTGEAGAKVQAEKLRVDTRKWLVAKLHPRQFGERVNLEHSGPDGGPIQSESEYRVTPEDEAILKRIAEKRAGLQQGQEGE